MAYGSYAQPQRFPGLTNPRPPERDPYLPQAQTGGGPADLQTFPSAGGLQPGAEPQPTGNGETVPTNTRQQALTNVQQAYQGRMPGQMDALNSALGQFQQPVGLTDPGIQPALRAGAGADQRSFERQRAALAELMGAQGLGDSGGFNTQVLGIGQKIGEAGSQRDAGLVYDEMGNRRNALLSALGMDQQRYNVDNDLAYRLAALEAQLNQQATQPFLI